jgi:PAS domain S-box-containing protein
VEGTLTAMPGSHALTGGIGLVALAAIAFALHRFDRTLPWRWLGLFALMQAADAWLGLFGAPVSFRSVAGALRCALGMCGSLALMEFARSGLVAAGALRLSRALIVGAGALAAAGALLGWPWPVDASGSALAVLAAGCAAALCWRLAQATKTGAIRASLQLAGGFFIAHAVALALSAPASGVPFPAVVADGVALLLAGAFLAHALWETDAASGRGPAHMRAVLLIGTVLLIGLALGLSQGLLGRLAVPGAVGAPILARLIPIGAGLLVAFVLYGGLTAWRSALAWARRMYRQELDLLGPIVEATRDGLLVVDETGEVVFRNSRFAVMWNVPRPQLEQRDAQQLWEALADQLVDAGGFQSMLVQARDSRSEQRDVIRFKDGRVFQVYSCSMPSEAELNGRAWSFKDITGLTSAEVEGRNQQIRLKRESDALARLSRRRLSQSGDLDAALREITKTAADTLTVEIVSAWLLDEEGMRIECSDLYERSHNRHGTSEPERAEAYSHFLAALEADGRVLVVHDVTEDPRVTELRERHLAPQRIAALLAVPVRLDGEMVGFILCMHAGSARHWAADEEQFAASLADHAAQAIERDEHRLTEQALGRNHELQQLIVDTAASAVVLADADGHITAVNEAFCSTTGFLPEELVGRHYTVLGSPACGEDCLLRDETAPPRRVARHVCRVVDREGRPRAVTLNAATVLDPDGTLIGIVISFSDVSDVVHVRGQVDTLLGETDAAREEAAAVRARLGALTAEFETMNASHQESLHRARTLEERAFELELQLEAANADLAAARDGWRAAETRADELVAQADTANLVEAEARVGRGDAEQRAAELLAELAETRGARAEAQRLVDDLTTAAADARARIERLADEAAQHATEQAQLRQAVEAAEARAAELETARGADEAIERRIAELEQALATARAKLDEARADAGGAVERIAMLLEQQRETQAQLSQALAELAAARAESEQTRKESVAMRAESEQIRAQLEAMQAESEQARTQLALLRTGSEQAQSELAALQAESERAQAELAARQAESERARNELATLQAESERARAEWAAARARLEQGRAETESLRSDLQAAQTARARFEDELVELQYQNQALETQLRETRGEIAHMKQAKEARATAAPQARPADDAKRSAARPAERKPSLLKVVTSRGSAKRREESVPAAAAGGDAVPAGRQPFDTRSLLQRVGGDKQLAAGRARAFQKGSAWMVACVRQALERKDSRALIGAARSLSGALGDVAAIEAQQLAEELAEMGRRKDLSGAPKVMRALEAEIERVRSALASFSRAA